MEQIKQNAGHIVIAVVIIGAIVFLCAIGKIDGATAVGVISAIGGAGLGGAVALSSGTAPAGTPTLSVPVKVQAQPSSSASTQTASEASSEHGTAPVVPINGEAPASGPATAGNV